MTSQQEKQCTHLILCDKGGNQKELQEQLEKGNSEVKYDALQKILLLHLSGEVYPHLLVTVIKFVLPTSNHKLKKLALYYLEVVDRVDQKGDLLQTMVLACNYIRKDLIHTNEYVRGIALRFLTRITEAELLESLVPEVKNNLTHRHSYVRRNAILAVHSIYKHHPGLIPDAPALVEEFLKQENDVSSQRNAFIMLFDCAQERAIRYLRSVMDTLPSSGDIFQLVLLDLLRKLAKSYPSERGKYLRVISSLMESKSSAVLYQCAVTLSSLSSSPVAIKAATTCYTRLISQISDNNVKLIVLDRLVELKQKYPKVMQESIMDVLRGLSSPDLEIRKKVLDLVVDLVSVRNVEEVMSFIKKELIKSGSADKLTKEEDVERKQLVKAIRNITLKFTQVAESIVPAVIEFLPGKSESSTDALYFVREAVLAFPTLRQTILSGLCDKFTLFSSPIVYRTAIWILGTYSQSEQEILEAFNVIKESFGSLEAPVDDALPEADDNSSVASDSTSVRSTPATSMVREDGTYISQVATGSSEVIETRSSVKDLLLSGDYFMGTVIAATLTKFVLKLAKVSKDKAAVNLAAADAMLVMCEIIRLGKSRASRRPIDPYSVERINSFIKILTNPDSKLAAAITEGSASAFARFFEISKKQVESAKADEAEDETKTVSFQPDSTINISQLRGKRAFDVIEFDDEELLSATGFDEKKVYDFSKVTQLTGADPIYAEATVSVQQFDIVLDILLANQTNETFQNLTVELATLGDLKLTERPLQYTLGPFATLNIKSSIKVASTENTGIIFGNIVFDTTGSANDKGCITMNEIMIDIMDYISPASCSEVEFRSMWLDFEWENKISVDTNISSIDDYVTHILKLTRMRLITPYNPEDGECDFFSANMYAKSSFGESALANISVERNEEGKLEGCIRVRSTSKGICLSMGDKLSRCQKADTKKLL